jgi:hypothetical protein
LPFLEEEISDNEKNYIEEKFWLQVLRAGGMEVEAAFKVLTNYLNIMRNHPEYFVLANPPVKMDKVFQRQVFHLVKYFKTFAIVSLF